MIKLEAEDISKEIEPSQGAKPNSDFSQPLPKNKAETNIRINKRTKKNMGRGDGILGIRDAAEGGSRATVTRRKKWLKRRERWLVVLGVVLHAVYMLSIFDIYFKTPIVHGMDPVTPRFQAPAKRLILLVGTTIINNPHLFVSLSNSNVAIVLKKKIKIKKQVGCGSLCFVWY